MQQNAGPSDSERHQALIEFGLQLEASGHSVGRDDLVGRAGGDLALVARVLDDLAVYRRAREALAAREPPPRFLTGDRLGDFELVGRIAVGGMGEVYRARQLSLGGRMVALKLLRVDARDSKAWTRFDREARVLASLHHPHLAAAYGAFEIGGVRCLAMQLVDGPTLAEIRDEIAERRELVRRPEVRRRIVERVAEVASALDVVHRSGLVHRDVKPENIVLAGGWASDEVVPDVASVLVDFGLARPIDDTAESRTGGTPATPNYASPEQLLGDPIDARSDVFSLGVTLHDLLSARRPSGRESAAHGLEPLHSLVDGIDRDLDALVARATDPDPDWRHSDAGELCADLRAWLAGEPSPLGRPPFGERLLRELRRSPRRLLRAASIVAGVVLVLWATIQVVLSHRRVSLAAEAHELGDLGTARELVTDLSPWSVRFATSDDSFGRFARRMQAREPGDPLNAIVDELRIGGRTRAFQLAALQLAKHGLASDEELLEFFERSLRVPNDAATRLAAAETLARLFYERPAGSLAEDRALLTLRSALRAKFEGAETHEAERLWCLSAFSGIALPTDAAVLAELAVAEHDASEVRRLALRAVERSLLRALARGLEAELPLAELLDRLAPPFVDAREAIACADPRAPNLGAPCANLARALAFVARARGDARTVGDWLRAVGWMTAPDPGYHAHARLDVRAALGEPGLVDELIDPMSWAPVHSHATCWGWSVGAYGEEALARQASELVPAELRATFVSAAQTAELELNGRDPSEDLDRDTLLVAITPVQAGEWAPLPSERHPPGDLPPIPSIVDDPDAELIASWNLHDQDHVVLDANATGARTLRAALAPDQPNNFFLRFGEFGVSQTELGFEARTRVAPFDFVLVLRHQLGVRPCYPFGGRVVLEVGIDGEPIVGELELSSTSYAESGLWIGWERMSRGGQNATITAHRISIRLHERSTTTYRLQEVELWRRTRP